MTASFPSSAHVFTNHVDITEIVYAAHVNTLQDEVYAIESNLGSNPQTSTAPSSSGTFNGASTPFATVNARLANIETGIVSDAHTQYLHKAGGDTITPSGASVKGLIFKATSGQTANLTEWYDSSNALKTYVDSSGNLNGALSSSITTTKGDIIVGGSSGAPTRFGVGATGTILTADSTQTNGVKWATAPNQTIGFSYAFLTMGA